MMSASALTRLGSEWIHDGLDVAGLKACATLVVNRRPLAKVAFLKLMSSETWHGSPADAAVAVLLSRLPCRSRERLCVCMEEGRAPSPLDLDLLRAQVDDSIASSDDDVDMTLPLFSLLDVEQDLVAAAASGTFGGQGFANAAAQDDVCEAAHRFESELRIRGPSAVSSTVNRSASDVDLVMVSPCDTVASALGEAEESRVVCNPCRVDVAHVAARSALAAVDAVPQAACAWPKSDIALPAFGFPCTTA